MKLEADLLSEPGTPLSGGDAFSCFLAVIARLPKQARAEALRRLEVAGAGPDLIGRLTVCLGLEPAAKEVRIETEIDRSRSSEMRPRPEPEKGRPESPPAASIVFQQEVKGAVFNFGPQQGIVSTGDDAENTQIVQRPGESKPSAPPGPEPEAPDFQSEQERAVFLQNWVRGQWKVQASGGTGRSGNVLLQARWQGQPALLEISADAAGLRAEAAHLDALRNLGVGLSVARLFAVAEVVEGDDRWMGYLMEPVGEMSLRDYLFTATPSPQQFLVSLGAGLATLYGRTARPTRRDFVARYVEDIRQSVEKARGYAPFARLAAQFDTQLVIKRETIPGPAPSSTAWRNGLSRATSRCAR